ncbi:MAG: tRNA (N6-threonylcarbamoyladenosine(37)-N6)-methyltransferase TrmO [Candidatus Heimdallarchaeota archaeon]|nr:tRNA (N6-threonylcarbamoyladenosine(37)-N6)-methyltransferase TrmO [Candidatus Heimdallarchaeota archaeon]
MTVICYSPIGRISTSFLQSEGTPIQASAARNQKGIIKLREEYLSCLKDIEGFSHLILIYHFHQAGEWRPFVKPFLDTETRGLFATRAPSRPNSIGISIVKLDRIENNKIYFWGVDILDETPLLDIKPYIPQFDINLDESVRIGWLTDHLSKLNSAADNGRFQHTSEVIK